MLIASLMVVALTGGATAQEPVTLSGQVVEAETGTPIPTADVVVLPGDRSSRTDASGRFRIRIQGPGRITVHVTRLGYAPRDTTLMVHSDTTVVVALATRPVDVETVAARVIRPPFARSGRELFDAEVRTGLVGMSRTEIMEMPTIGEVDVLRALQALPGVVAVNDLASTLHVMGGGPDQNVFLWDGARVFAPYHMFGILGAFPAAAIDGVEFYRGAVPARYDDAMSAVVDIKQGGRDDGYFADGSVSTIAAGATLGGPLPVGEGEWMVGGRRTHFDRFLTKLEGDREFPYAFHDAHGLFSWAPTPAHHLQLSFLVTSDRLAARAGSLQFPGQLELATQWSNTVFSGSWQWAGEGPWSSRLGAAWSEYDGALEVGDLRGSHGVTDEVELATVDFQLRRRLGAHAVHMGVLGEGGRVNLVGSEGGGYVDGGRDGTVAVVGGFAEATLELGRFRVVPGLRVDVDLPRTGLLVQPRVAVRYQATDDLSITLGAGRTAQRLHAVRDARTVLPGAPLWVAPTAHEPVSTADALTGEVTWWFGDTWSIDVGGYLRRLRNVPMWFPEGSRELESFRFDHGRAVGAELLVRRHGEGVTGWLAYGLADVEQENAETGRTYHPPWDRRHSVDAAAFIPLVLGIRATGRLTFATGTAFWPFSGYQPVVRIHTATGRLYWDNDDDAPYWSLQQMRMPKYFRLDFGLRGEFELFGVRLEPHAGVLNATARPNVLYYRADRHPHPDSPLTGEGVALYPETASSTNLIPSFGLNVYF